MNIEAEIQDINGNIEIDTTDVFCSIKQESDHVCIRKDSAKQLIEVLKEWVESE